MLSAAAILVVPLALHAQSAPTQSTVAAETDAMPWIPCSTADDRAQDTQPPPAAPGRARIVMRGDTMSLEVRACPLTQLLNLISTHSGIRIVVSEAIPPEPLSLRTRAQSIEATLRTVLRETDLFVLYTAAPGAEQRLAAVWVYPRGSTRDLEPVPADRWVTTTALERQLTESNPELRARAIEELIARAGEAALPHVFDAFADENADVRLRALDAAFAASLDVPLQQLHALAVNDLSPEVRLRALQALEERSDSAWIVEAATYDTDSNVRNEAQSILRRLNQVPR